MHSSAINLIIPAPSSFLNWLPMSPSSKKNNKLSLSDLPDALDAEAEVDIYYSTLQDADLSAMGVFVGKPPNKRFECGFDDINSLEN